jgi:hypothetical protein
MPIILSAKWNKQTDMDVAVLQKLFLSRRLQVEKLRMPAKIKGE